MTIEISLAIILFFSLITNAILCLLLRYQSQKLLFVSENITDLLTMIGNFKKHLKEIYSLEMFYGDETLEYLLQHTRDLIQILENDYEDIANIMQPEQFPTEEQEFLLNEEETEEEENQENEKHVLYAGTRKRNS
tara:strand:+ start:746 stop:1150 length:405 start_codon:yes stop_codon:yes gene_type:complete